jgi:hypothetical protein
MAFVGKLNFVMVSYIIAFFKIQIRANRIFFAFLELIYSMLKVITYCKLLELNQFCNNQSNSIFLVASAFHLFCIICPTICAILIVQETHLRMHWQIASSARLSHVYCTATLNGFLDSRPVFSCSNACT